MHVTGLVHVNINCRDYERSRRFYELLGFREVWRVPETNTEAVNAAVGMRDYRVRGALLALQSDGTTATDGFIIDLLEWVSPRDDSPPYPNLHRPGIARIALRTTDLDADVAALQAQGVVFLSEPATVMVDAEHGSRFVCFRDPDGTFLELVESF